MNRRWTSHPAVQINTRIVASEVEKMKKYLQYIIPVVILGGLLFYVFSNFQSQSADSFFKDYTAEVYYSESCGCCVNYIGYLRNSGFKVNAIRVDDTKETKDGLKIPGDLRSCHTTKIGNYFIEGHVPVEAIKKLLIEKPAIDGIALPGMPSGSPGMPGPKVPFEILGVKGGKSTGLFVRL